MFLVLQAADFVHRLLFGLGLTGGYHLASISVLPLISESLPLAWYSVRLSGTANLLLFLWLPLATVLSWAYESNLLSGLTVASYQVRNYGFSKQCSPKSPIFEIPFRHRSTPSRSSFSPAPLSTSCPSP